MPHRNLIVTYLGLAMLAPAAGCGRSDGTQTPPAAIDASGGASPTAGEAAKLPPADLQHPVVAIETTLGNITVELDREKARGTVDNFLAYVDAAHYDQTAVHQVYKGQLFIAGGYGANLVERPVRTAIFNEADNGLKNARGTIAMARLPDSIHSATCQFFVNVADNPALDYKDRSVEGYGYCVFGKVTAGMEVVDRIADARIHDTPAFDRTPVDPIVIKLIRRLR